MTHSNKFPISLDRGWWAFGGLPIECWPERKFPSSDIFVGADAGKLECAKRNLFKVEADGIADQQMPWPGLKCPPTYREFYQSKIVQLRGMAPAPHA